MIHAMCECESQEIFRANHKKTDLCNVLITLYDL